MLYSNRLLTLIVAAAFLYSAAPASADGACDRDPATFKLKIKVRENRPVEVTHRGENAEDLRVCVGDSVEWKLINPASADDFFVEFSSGAPFPGPALQNASNGKVLVTIGGSAAMPGASFKYDIGITGGGVWDPRIIIDE